MHMNAHMNPIGNLGKKFKLINFLVISFLAKKNLKK